MASTDRYNLDSYRNDAIIRAKVWDGNNLASLEFGRYLL